MSLCYALSLEEDWSVVTQQLMTTYRHPVGMGFWTETAKTVLREGYRAT